MNFADIILPLAQPCYTFAVSHIPDIKVGEAVAVQFGPRNIYTGIVLRLHNNPPKRGRVKPVLQRLYNFAVLTPKQIEFWSWMSSYYLSTLGEVMRIALPSLIKPHATSQELYIPYSLPTEKVVRLKSMPDAETLDRMSRRAPRRAALLAMLQRSGGEIARHECSADAAVITALTKAGYIETILRECEPKILPISHTTLPVLSAEQSKALERIESGLEVCNVALLHGVTSSGKTEIYTHRIAHALSREQDVLLLVPEISLTAQLVERMRQMFGDRVIAYHSKLTPLRRTQIYMDMLRTGSGRLIVGARSALFLPYKSLGLVVVDEEHDSSYKQSEPSPRYHGRDAAVMLASLHGAKAILGSATPSLESFNNAMAGKYAGVTLMSRYGGSLPPKIIISDTMRSVKRGERKSHFNKELLDRIADRLQRREQIMLFQNRRGYAPYVECPRCGWTARCPHCNVTLSRHLNTNSLRCHYCGYSIEHLQYCPECKTSQLETKGFGTEKVEEEISALFPTARILRLDSDTASSDSAYNRIISQFAAGEADILVGTQIITKGLDFKGVTLIGVLNADNLTNAPDFRAVERAWQTMLQVAGRAGRRDKAGEVVVQTSDPSHPVFAALSEQGYQHFATAQLRERQMFNYPPFSRLIRITLRHISPERLAKAASQLGVELRSKFGGRVLGPVTPLVDRIRQEYIVQIIIKIENGASFSRAKEIVAQHLTALQKSPTTKGLTTICDIDPA
ncbi:MAG: primosomal protein N' [Rikenellaceae bacterium]|nr:primosomal protein N' [Rikenellaceae bacterium]